MSADHKPRNRWDPITRARGIARSMVVGTVQTSKEMAIPRRTLSGWIGGEVELAKEDVAALKAEASDRIVAEMLVTLEESLASIREGLSNPRARLSDKAQVVDVLTRSAQLLGGGATSRTDSRVLHAEVEPRAVLTLEEESALRDYLDAQIHPEWFDEEKPDHE